MNRILAIADDFTGAAEIAGIGFRFGLPTRLSRTPRVRFDEGLTVLDTDSRLLSDSDSAVCVRRFAKDIDPKQFDLIYKKTDSVLRGPVRVEIETLMDVFHRRCALLAPQNPSRGRTIEGGVYRIDGVPLDQTPFADDPDHPARSANVVERFGRSKHQITIADASTRDQMLELAHVTEDVLPAGGADFFQALLESRGLVASRTPLSSLPAGATLFVCGSTSSSVQGLIDRARQQGIPICPMPDDDSWTSQVISALDRASRALMVIARPIDRTPGAGQGLLSHLARTAANILSEHRVTNLLVEGGATASAVCRAMNWSDFEVAGEFTTGVVLLRCGERNLVVKPGSYPWPGIVFGHQ